MDFMDPGPLLSGAVISMVGLGVFLHAKKMQAIEKLGIGLVMMTYPMFVHSVLWMWVIAALCLTGLYFLPRSA